MIIIVLLSLLYQMQKKIIISITILAIIWLCYYINTLFIDRTIFVVWWNAYSINPTLSNFYIKKVAYGLENPKVIQIGGWSRFIKDNSNVFEILSCTNTPWSGFDAGTFEGFWRGTGWAGIVVKDKNGTYISHRDGKYGRPEGNCSNEQYAPYKKISE